MSGKVIHLTEAENGGSRFASVRSLRKSSKTVMGSDDEVCKGTTICEDTLEDFLSPSDVTGLHLYTYCGFFYEVKLSGTCTPTPANDPFVAGEIARWFLHRPKAFGKYKLRERNCESFVNFCKTASVTVAELSRAYDRIGDDARAWHQYLASAGSAHTEQSSLLTLTAPLRVIAKAVLAAPGKAFAAKMFSLGPD